MKRSPWVYVISQGTCNGCELEIRAAFDPVFDVERFGIKLVSSPRHADVVLVTGCGTPKASKKAARVLEQVPEPKVVVQIGACALNGGIFKCDGPRIEGDTRVQGCPPRPTAIIQAIKEAVKCSSKH